MGEHWRSSGSGTGWLDPAAYDALSAAEKRALWRQRQACRPARRAARPRRRGHYARQRLVWLGVVMLATVAATSLDLSLTSLFDRGGGTALPAASTPTTASFGLCQWGGGTNCVVDGDTFYIAGDKVRIAGIDAPETHDFKCASELALGNQATDKLHALLNSGAVTMTSIDRDRDAYGRLLRNVQVDGADVGAAMIAAGVAREYGGGRRPWC